MAEDGDHCAWRQRVLSPPHAPVFDHHNVGYVMGLAKNDRALKQAEALRSEAQQPYHATKEKQRLFADIRYAAESWDRIRLVIVKAQRSVHGSNPRFVVTNLEGEAQYLYDKLYCARGEMENRMKQQQLRLFY